MRLVQIGIPSGKRDAILRTFEDADLEYVVSDETGGQAYAAIAYVPLPANAVEPILADLRDAGLDEEALTVVVEASSIISRQFEDLADRYAEEEDADRIAREELTANAAGLAPGGFTYAALIVLSALIATAGLLLDSPAVVVGSMVIAPLVGPALSASVGTVVNDQEMFQSGVKLQIFGLVLAVLAAAIFAVFVRSTNLIQPIADVTTVPEIHERIAPNFLSLVVAVGAGLAGIISLTSGVSTALVGVMIAAALIPPAATVGIGIAWGEPLVTLGSGVLVLLNVLSINLAALVLLWYKGYRPEHWFREEEARSATITRVGVLVVGILVLSVFLGGVTYDSYTRATVEEDLRDVAAAEVAAMDEALQDRTLTLLAVDVQHTNAVIFQEPSHIEITIGVPPETELDGFVGSFDAELDEAAGRDVTTRLRYIRTESSGS